MIGCNNWAVAADRLEADHQTVIRRSGGTLRALSIGHFQTAECRRNQKLTQVAVDRLLHCTTFAYNCLNQSRHLV